MDEQDPLDFLLEVSKITRSQEDILTVCNFPGDPVNAGGNPPPRSSDNLADKEDPAALLMFSLPETQYDAGKVAAGGSGTQEQDDVFHTPPEKNSVPSSSDQPPSEHCEVNHELDAYNYETIGFVDLGNSQGKECANLGKDSELGFSEVQPSQKVEGEIVAQSPRGIKRDAVAEVFEGFKRETCIDELPTKKSKLSEPNLGLESSRASLGTQPQELEEGNGNCNVGAYFQSEKVDLAEEQVSKDNEVSVQKNNNNLGSCQVNEANELGSGKEKGQKKNKNFVFNALKFLSENSAKNDKDNKGGNNDSENHCLMDVVKLCDVEFPRPRWWPDTDLFRM